MELLTFLVNSFLLPDALIGVIVVATGLTISSKIQAHCPRLHTISRWLLGFAVIFLYLLATPIGTSQLISPLETIRPLEQQVIPSDAETSPKAIVVLTGGQNWMPHRGEQLDINAETLQRVRYAAQLYRQTHLPILISGGQPTHITTAEAITATRVLQDDFHVPTMWLESQSKNTWENAYFVAKILNREQIKHFYLVTSAWHLPRALYAFKQQGLNPIPAPSSYLPDHLRWLRKKHWYANANSLAISNIAVHEYMGLLWYHLKSLSPNSTMMNRTR